MRVLINVTVVWNSAKKRHYIMPAREDINLPAYSRVFSKVSDFIDTSEITPVSYTHLDVYKRQNFPSVYQDE